MKVIFIGSDESIFDKKSNTFLRMVEYSKLFDELHIVVFSKSKQANFSEGNLFVYSTKSIGKLLAIIDSYLLISKIIGSKKEEWVLSSQDPFESGLVAFWVKMRFGVPFQSQVHTDFLSPYFSSVSFLNFIRRVMAGFILKRADNIRVVSSRIKNSIIKNYSISESRVDILPIFTDVSLFEKGGNKFVFKQFNPNWKYVFLTVARLETEKNFFTLIDVFENLVKENKGVVWLIVGGGRLKNKIEETIKRRDLSENIILLGNKREVAEIYRGVDCYVQASFFEGFGLSIVEALLSGLPIITTDVGAVGSIIDRENVAICGANDKKCFENLIRDFLKGGELVPKVSSDSLKKLIGRLTIDRENYLNNYKTLLDKIHI